MSTTKKAIINGYSFFFKNFKELSPFLLVYLFLELLVSGVGYHFPLTESANILDQGAPLLLFLFISTLFSYFLLMSFQIVMGRRIILGEAVEPNILKTLFSLRFLRFLGAHLIHPFALLLLASPFIVLLFVLKDQGIGVVAPIAVATLVFFLWSLMRLSFFLPHSFIEDRIAPLEAFRLSKGFALPIFLSVVLVGSLFIMGILALFIGSFLIMNNSFSLEGLLLMQEQIKKDFLFYMGASFLQNFMSILIMIPNFCIFYLYKQATNR